MAQATIKDVEKILRDYSIANAKVQTPAQPTSGGTLPEDTGIIGSIGRGISSPIRYLGRDMADIISPIKTYLSGGDWTQGNDSISTPYLTQSEEDNRRRLMNEDPAMYFAQRAADWGSWLVPQGLFGKGLTGAMATGALGAGLGGFAQSKNQQDLGKLATDVGTSSLFGAGTSGVAYGIGQGLKNIGKGLSGMQKPVSSQDRLLQEIQGIKGNYANKFSQLPAGGTDEFGNTIDDIVAKAQQEQGGVTVKGINEKNPLGLKWGVGSEPTRIDQYYKDLPEIYSKYLKKDVSTPDEVSRDILPLLEKIGKKTESVMGDGKPVDPFTVIDEFNKALDERALEIGKRVQIPSDIETLVLDKVQSTKNLRELSKTLGKLSTPVIDITGQKAIPTAENKAYAVLDDVVNGILEREHPELSGVLKDYSTVARIKNNPSFYSTAQKFEDALLTPKDAGISKLQLTGEGLKLRNQQIQNTANARQQALLQQQLNNEIRDALALQRAGETKSSLAGLKLGEVADFAKNNAYGLSQFLGPKMQGLGNKVETASQNPQLINALVRALNNKGGMQQQTQNQQQTNTQSKVGDYSTYENFIANYGIPDSEAARSVYQKANLSGQ